MVNTDMLIIILSVIAATQIISTTITMSRLSDLESALTNINTKLEKARAEIVAAVAALQEQINNAGNPELSAGAQAQLDALNAVAESLDALNPDAPEVPPAPTE